VAQYGRMATSSRFKFTATILVSLLGFVLTLIAPDEADVGQTSTAVTRVPAKH